MSLKEKFALILTAEPYKSFRKKGITNGDDALTSDGREIFLSYLLTKYADDFKATIVDLIEEEKEK